MSNREQIFIPLKKPIQESKQKLIIINLGDSIQLKTVMLMNWTHNVLEIIILLLFSFSMYDPGS